MELLVVIICILFIICMIIWEIHIYKVEEEKAKIKEQKIKDRHNSQNAIEQYIDQQTKREIEKQQKINQNLQQAYVDMRRGLERENFFLNYIDSLENNNQSAND